MVKLNHLVPWAAAISAAAQVQVTVTTDSVLSLMPPHLAGMGWEMYVMLNTYLPHLNDTVYREIASGLSGATVRVGGITCDWVRYVVDDETVGSAEHRALAVAARAARIQADMDNGYLLNGHKGRLGYWPTTNENITTSDFSALVDFFTAAGMHLLFDLNELYGRNCNTTKPGCPTCSDWCVGAWDTSNVRAFLQWVHDKGIYVPPNPDGTPRGTLVGFELGNELIGHLDPVANANDIITLAGIIKDIWTDVPANEVPPLFAPSTDNCFDNSTHGIMTNVTGYAQVFTYHAYPGQSGTGPDNLTSILLNSTWLRTGIMTGSDSQQCISWWNAGPRQAGMGLWVTEASSSWAWDLPPPAQNSYIHGFFTIPELGQYAATGIGMVGRWAFSEPSPFGLIVQNGTRWDVASDYWLLTLFNSTRAVGTGSGVLAVTGDQASDALVYAHCYWLPGSITIMAVNPSEAPVQLNLVGSDGSAIQTTPRNEFVLTPPAGNLSSTTPVLNGNDAAPLRVNVDGTMPPLLPAYVGPEGDTTLTLPPRSQAFFVLLNAQASPCTAGMGKGHEGQRY